MQSTQISDFREYGYEVISTLGVNHSGGRVTYLAIQGDAKVVIKQFQFAKDAGWEGFKSWERELDLLKALDHPRIPKYLGRFDSVDGVCLVQEYKDAQPLTAPRPYTTDQIKSIATQVLETLEYLQSLHPPVLHRDLQPGNILMDDRGDVYLVDFGFARLGGQNLAQSSMVVGSMGFMAPEQMLGRDLTIASDLYSLGATLICLLTGTPSGKVGSLVDDSFKFTIPNNLDDSFRKWLKKMVAPRVGDRYQSAKDALFFLNPMSVELPIGENGEMVRGQWRERSPDLHRFSIPMENLDDGAEAVKAIIKSIESCICEKRGVVVVECSLSRCLLDYLWAVPCYSPPLISRKAIDQLNETYPELQFHSIYPKLEDNKSEILIKVSSPKKEAFERSLTPYQSDYNKLLREAEHQFGDRVLAKEWMETQVDPMWFLSETPASLALKGDLELAYEELGKAVARHNSPICRAIRWLYVGWNEELEIEFKVFLAILLSITVAIAFLPAAIDSLPRKPHQRPMWLAETYEQARDRLTKAVAPAKLTDETMLCDGNVLKSGEPCEKSWCTPTRDRDNEICTFGNRKSWDAYKLHNFPEAYRASKEQESQRELKIQQASKTLLQRLPKIPLSQSN